MIALSIRQPWAWLIVNGHKPVENRTWSTNRRGRLLIHAGQVMTRADYEACTIFIAGDDRIRHVLDVLPPADALDRGGIVGVAHLVACRRVHESPWFGGPYGFELAEAKPVPFQACKGKLSFFETGIRV